MAPNQPQSDADEQFPLTHTLRELLGKLYGGINDRLYGELDRIDNFARSTTPASASSERTVADFESLAKKHGLAAGKERGNARDWFLRGVECGERITAPLSESAPLSEEHRKSWQADVNELVAARKVADELRAELAALRAETPRGDTAKERRFPICKDHVAADWNQPTLEDDACVLCRLFYLEAQEGLLEEWQQRAERAEDAIAEVKRPLDEQMARLNATVVRLNEELDALRSHGGTAKPDFEKLYHELLFAVGNKYPGETRHHTALRYILNAERGSNQAQASPSSQEEK